MDFGTKKEAQGQGYAGKGFGLMLDEITKRPDIKDVQIQAFNPLTSKIVDANLNENFVQDGMGTTIFTNPNFDIKYEELCAKIQAGQLSNDMLNSFCGDDNYMLETAKNLLALYEKFQESAREIERR
jgi:hypothetical protein